jgi:PhnB protein
MTVATNRATTNSAIEETQIRALVEERVAAIRAKDADAFLFTYAPDVVMFSLAPPLQTRGVDKKAVEAWLASWQGPIGYEVRDLSIATGDDLAFCHGLSRLNATGTDGQQVNLWARETLCCRKIDGAWKVAHEHSSVPFYMDGSVKAAVDLEP